MKKLLLLLAIAAKVSATNSEVELRGLCWQASNNLPPYAHHAMEVILKGLTFSLKACF